MKWFFQRLWAFWFYFVFGGLFLILSPLFYILLSREAWYPAADKLRRFWAFLLFPLLGVLPRITYAEKLDPKQRYIFCANHSSYLDIPYFGFIFHGVHVFMAKAELKKIPIFGMFFGTIDIAVDRGNKAASYGALKEGARRLDMGANLIIFPEGGISKKAPLMRSFKDGSFKLAIEKKISIVPITFLDNWRIFHDNGKVLGRPGISRAVVHKPIRFEEMTDISSLKQKVYDIIEGPLKEHYEDRFRNDSTIG